MNKNIICPKCESSDIRVFTELRVAWKPQGDSFVPVETTISDILTEDNIDYSNIKIECNECYTLLDYDAAEHLEFNFSVGSIKLAE